MRTNGPTVISHYNVQPVIDVYDSGWFRAGVRLLPGIIFLGVALGLVIVSQTVSLLERVGAEPYAGTVMVTVDPWNGMPHADAR